MEGGSEGGSFTLDVQSTTGGSFTLNLDRAVTVDQLKKLVSRRLKLSKDRICLLHRERQLREGTLEENGLADGARVILLPSVETGLLSQRTENSVMQALESLNDTQVNDFLSGKSPLNLTMRLGDHTMLIQLQLSTLNSGACSRGPSTSVFRTRRASDSSPAKKNSPKSKAKSDDKQKTKEILEKALDLISMTELKDIDEILEKEEASANEAPMKLRPRPERSPIKSLSKLASSPVEEALKSEVEKSIKYVPLPSSVKSNLIKTIQESGEGSSMDAIVDPIAANLTSCLCSSLNPGFPCDSECRPAKVDVAVGDDTELTEEQGFLTESTLDEYPMENFFNNAVDQGLFEDAEDVEVDREMSTLARSAAGPAGGGNAAVAEPLPSFQTLTDTNKNKRLHYLLHKTSKYKHPISQNKQKAFMQSVVNKHIKRSLNRQDAAQASTSRTEPFAVSPRKLTLIQASEEDPDDPQPSTSQSLIRPFKVIEAPKTRSQSNSTTAVTFDSKALIEASKNLTQTLKKLSKEVLVSKAEEGEEEETLRTKTGAVIESMKHHGKGIYSGTFSGTLNPALQDRYGRPKRDISTIIHILNDLLCATPPLKAPKERKSASPPATSHKIECGCGVACAYGQCDGHYPSTSSAPAPDHGCACRDHVCSCKSRRETNKCKCGESTSCTKCNLAKTLAIDNCKTKCKVEQLRLVMQQKKERREARKLQAGPYMKPPPPPEKSPRAERIDTLA